ncbi:MAG TPA: LON peptidase substrate-binding domain-containing protein [Candidatus Cybelea sp.]|nr:LON peptidase substrate-binding domain-containing protein [Candidatus Cybelea sp.]
MRPARIPLFPLELALLPGMPIPLHIFEPRYKTMIARCLRERLEFGLVLAQERSPAAIGCTAEITRKIKDYADGRMDILVEGRAIFRLIEMHDEKEYYEGIVDYLPEDATPQDPRREQELTDIFQQCHIMLFGHVWPGAEPHDWVPLAYRFAARLPLDSRQRQRVLEQRSEAERREFLFRYTNELLPRLAQRQIARQTSAGSGHGIH